ncbi:MAG: zinc ribbon domain-containing protein [Rhodocyclaceae bacterium]
MPIYEYRCTACGFKKEYLQRLSDAPLTDCPECGGATFDKLLSAGSFQLKGSGWYATDFKGGAKAKSSGSPAAGKAESKPACGAGGCPAST